MTQGRPRWGTKAWFRQNSPAHWIPISWDGWLVLVLFVLGVGAPIPFVGDDDPGAPFIAWVVLLTLGLLALCIVRSEPMVKATRRRRRR